MSGNQDAVIQPIGDASQRDIGNDARWLGHPRGVFLVAFTELWERFSFYGVTSLFVLFLVGSSAAGGWGWSQESALLFNGWYMGALMMAPLLGGWLSTRYISERTCITLGAVLIMTGHILFFVGHYAPVLAAHFAGFDVAHILSSPGLELGALSPDARQIAQLSQAIAQTTPSAGEQAIETVIWAYRANALFFYAAIAFLFLGTALIKPTVSSIVARFYRPEDPRRSEGFQLLFFGLYLGCTLGITLPGLLGERLGWHYGFSVAGLGMAIGLVVYLAFQKRLLGNVGSTIARSGAADPAVDRQISKDRFRAYLAHGVFTVIYMAIFYQVIGLLSLFIRDHVDRNVLGFEVPTTWVQNVSVILFLVWTPCIGWATRRLARASFHFSATLKSVVALIILAIGYGILAVAVQAPHPTLLWFVVSYCLFGLGDALLGPAQVALATRLAPSNRNALYVSGWFVFVGLGALASGYIGAGTSGLPLTPVLSVLAIVALVAGIAYAGLARWIARRSHGADLLPTALQTG